MNRSFKAVGPLAALLCGLSAPLRADLITNGGFESGLAGWTRVDQSGGDGTFALQTGTNSPVNSFTVPAPPGGLNAAMTDSFGPGSHLLYQDFIVPISVTGPYIIGFSLYINNDHDAPDFFAPSNLDFSTPALNQQARVDIVKVSGDPFTLAAADILQSLFRTLPGDAAISGYTNFSIDLTALLQANQGQTLRLRFAETDNVAPFNLGVDNVSINASAVPEPSTWILMAGALFALAAAKRRYARL
jgi:hypothetical protein